jgi:glycosyltransferase involved in cell wall biosynthesis
VIVLLHNRYRTPGGEERAVEDLAWLIREHLGEEVRSLCADSSGLGAGRAGRSLLRGGRPVDVTGARVVHAHNVHPEFGFRALEAARMAGARVVHHLHNYRLVCAVGTCFTRGEDCTRCHGRWTWPGVRLNCRGASRAESAVYGLALARQQRRLAAATDTYVVPSEFALGRLRELGAPVGDRARVIASVQREFATGPVTGGTYALAAGRLSAEKGFEDAVAGCARAGVPLVVAGDGPDAGAVLAAARDVASSTSDPRSLRPGQALFAGRVSPARLAELRAGAAVAIVPSRYAEILPLAALEAMAAGLPVVAARSGGLAEIVPEEGLYPPGDAVALCERVRALWADPDAGVRALAAARERTAPEVVAAALREVYGL